MDAQEKKLVEDAISLLNSSANCECYCGQKDCTVHTPKCQTMEVRAAMNKLTAILDPEMKTLQPNRLTNPPERIYFERWVKLNKRDSGINEGYTALELILSPNCQKFPPRPSQRDAEVATTIIQWIGTNCGRGFIEECERQIKSESAERSATDAFMVMFSRSGRERDLFERLSDKILKDIVPQAKYAERASFDRYGLAHIRGKIRDVFNVMFALYSVETGLCTQQEAADSAGFPLERFKELMALGRRSVADCVVRLRESQANKKQAV